MARLDVNGPTLTVHLTTTERVAALPGDLSVPLDRVVSVEAVPDPLRYLRGIRAPGLWLPRTRIGSWTTRSGRAFTVVHQRRPGVRIALDEHGPYRQILLSVDDPQATRDAILAALPAGEAAAPGEHAFRFRSVGIDLAGTLTLPDRPSDAVALVLNGSGPIDRDGDAGRMRLGISRGIAAALADAGVASLRYDKRGVGASGGSTLHGGLHDLIDDAAAAARALHEDPRTAGRPLIVIGHSEGAALAVSLAADQPVPIDGVILLAASAKTGEQTLIWQLGQVRDALPAVPRTIVRLLRVDLAAKQQKTLARYRSSTGDVLRIQGIRTNARWMREFLDFDPVPLLARISVPVLAVTGTKDLQVDPEDLTVIAATVRGPVSTHRIEDLTHLLRRDPAPPTLRAYRRLIRQPVDGEVLRLVCDAAGQAGGSVGGSSV